MKRRRHPSLPKRSKGIALLTAILIMALITLVTVNLEWDTSVDLRRTTVMLFRDQAIQVALGAESWVMDVLRQDLQDGQTDHLGEIWASELPGFPIEGGEVFGSIVDLQSRFNINNLIDQNGEVHEESLEQFRRLLNALGLDPRYAGITADWLDTDFDAGQIPETLKEALVHLRGDGEMLATPPGSTLARTAARCSRASTRATPGTRSYGTCRRSCPWR